MATADLFDRVSDLLEEIGAEKSAAVTKRAMDDPGSKGGTSSHPSATIEDDSEVGQPAPEGAQSADNTKTVKEQTPGVVDKVPPVTPESAPKQDEVQLGQGVDAAKPTGEDPGVERDYKGTKDDPAAGSRGLGGTEHPASGDFGEKYSADQLATMSDTQLFKLASDIGNEVLADIANGFLAPPKQAAAPTKVTPEQAAAAGYKAASTVGQPTDSDVAAGNIIVQVVKTAQHQADLIAQYLQQTQKALKAAEDEMEDPTGGAAEGEDHGTEEAPTDPAAGEAGGAGGEEEALLAAMAGGAPEGAGAAEMAPGAGGMPGEEAAPGGGGAGLGAPPDAMGGMSEEEALQQLAMALMELGIDPAMLAQAGGPAPKLASAVSQYKKAGKFKLAETKTAAERSVRDYMKSYIIELCKRSR